MGLKLIGEVSLDGAGFERGLTRLGETAASSLKSLIVGAVGVYGLESALSKTVETADELVTTSKRLDLTVEQLQILRQAAKDNNVEFTALAGAFEKMDVARAKALGGGRDSARYLKAFASLGVSQADLQSKTAASLFENQISASVKMINPEQIAEPLRDVFGRAFGELLPVLKTDFGELDSTMRQYGAVMDTTTAVQLKQFKDEMGLIGNVISAELAPVLVKFGKTVYEVLTLLGVAGTFWGSLASAIFSTDRDSAIERVLHPGAFLFNAAMDATDDASGFKEGRDAVMNQFDSRMKEIANELNNPKPPAFGGLDGAGAVEKKRRERMMRGDALLESGNFLGAHAAGINSIAEQQLQAQREQLQISRETNQILRAVLPGFGAVEDALSAVEFPN